MKVRFTAHGVNLSRNARIMLVDRAQRILSKLASSIANISVTIKDINGPRGGRDKVCTLRAQLAGGGDIIVTDRSRSLGRALVRCVHRSRNAIRRELKRRQEKLAANDERYGRAY